MSPPLLLASASPRRREILGRLGYLFAVVPAAVEEHEPVTTDDPRALVAHNAALKAAWVAARHPEAAVLGADTTVFLDGEAFHKPADLAAARRMLHRLAGRTHSVCTAVALRLEGRADDLVVESRVTFRPLDDALIDRYFASCNPLDKAGAYGIQNPDFQPVCRFPDQHRGAARRRDESALASRRADADVVTRFSA